MKKKKNNTELIDIIMRMDIDLIDRVKIYAYDKTKNTGLFFSRVNVIRSALNKYLKKMGV